jgi:hypothetical protein
MFKLFGSKKNNDFFVEIGDSAEASAAPVAEAPKAPAEVEAAPVAEAPAQEKKTKKTSIKEKAAKAEAPVAPAAPLPAPVALKKPASVVLFSPDYLIAPNSASTRRRPGANMNGFLDMAKQYKQR